MTIREPVSEYQNNGRSRDLWLEVTQIPGETPQERCFLIVFAKDAQGNSSEKVEVPEPDAANVDEQVQSLKRELLETREYLRHMTEQYQAHAEELRAANEEARSANEELQSINEELGTTKEELQSANEELITVNEELQSRNKELAGTNSDLKNLLSAVSLAILMVDEDLRIRRFNTAAERLLQLSPIDIGRPVGHLRGQIETPQLEAHIRRVIDTLSPVSNELQDSGGRWYAVAVRPYRTVDDRIAGAVITFQEIDQLKRGLEASETARLYAEALIETVRQPLVVLDADLRVQRATSAFYEKFMISREETDGRFLYDLGNGQWNLPRLRELLGNALFRSQPFADFEVEHDFPHVGRRTMRLNGRRIPQREPEPRSLLLAIEDVTERRELAEIRCQRLFETAKDGMVVLDAETKSLTDVNRFFLELTGFQRHDFVGRNVSDLGALLGWPEFDEIVSATEQSEVVRRDNLEITARSGALVPIEVVANRYLVGTHPVVQLNIRDIAPRQNAARALKESEERFRLVVESVRDYAIFQLDDQGNIITWNTGAERLLGWGEAEVIGRSGKMVFTPEDIERGEADRELATARTEGRAEDERWHMRKNGSRFFASGVLTFVNPKGSSNPVFTKVMQDITTRKEQDELLRQSLDQKSTLVREIHHRVKNNLQTIVSLLRLQATHTKDPQLLAAFEETMGRVRAVAQIHEQLYASEDLREVEVGTFLKALAGELLSLHSTVPDRVQLNVSVPEMVLPIEKAIPVGLIANELIMNSLKHGLRQQSGSVQVTLEHVAPAEPGSAHSHGRARLQVRDTGRGFPAGFDPSKVTSMGYRLINMLLRQLRAQMEIGGQDGASVSVTFPLSAGAAQGER
jgi:PAS domain S-box-containing protein